MSNALEEVDKLDSTLGNVQSLPVTQTRDAHRDHKCT